MRLNKHHHQITLTLTLMCSGLKQCFTAYTCMLQVTTLRAQAALQARALQVAEAKAAQLVASKAEVESLRQQSAAQLQAAESAAQELRAAQAEVRNK